MKFYYFKQRERNSIPLYLAMNFLCLRWSVSNVSNYVEPVLKLFSLFSTDNEYFREADVYLNFNAPTGMMIFYYCFFF